MVVVVVVVLSVCDLFPSQNRSLTPNKNASPQNLASSYVFMNILLCSALVSYHAKPRWFCNVCREMGVLRSRVGRVQEGMESRNLLELLTVGSSVVADQVQLQSRVSRVLLTLGWVLSAAYLSRSPTPGWRVMCFMLHSLIHSFSETR